MRRTFELADKIALSYEAGGVPESSNIIAAVGKCFLCDKTSAKSARAIVSVAVHDECYNHFRQEVQSVRESIFKDNRARILIMMAAGLLVRDVRGIIARHMLHIDPSEPYRLMSLVKFPTPPKSIAPDIISLFCGAAIDRLIKG
jgi:hypothetical protein